LSEFVLTGDGSELTGSALRGWCRFGGIGDSRVGPDSSWENAFEDDFDSLIEAKVVIEE